MIRTSFSAKVRHILLFAFVCSCVLNEGCRVNDETDTEKLISELRESLMVGMMREDAQNILSQAGIDHTFREVDRLLTFREVDSVEALRLSGRINAVVPGARSDIQAEAPIAASYVIEIDIDHEDQVARIDIALEYIAP